MRFIRFHIASLLILTFSVALCYQTFTVAYFYWNRAEIAEKHCVNKDKPQMNCHGKCHLEKQLTAQTPPAETDAKTSTEPLSFWLFGVELPKAIRIYIPGSEICHQTCYHYACADAHLPGKFVPPDFM